MAILHYKALFFSEASEYIERLSETEQAKIYASITIMTEGDFQSVETKLLKSPVKELKIKKHRITFFIKENTIYFLTGFLKKTSKTPKKELERAHFLYKQILASL